MLQPLLVEQHVGVLVVACASEASVFQLAHFEGRDRVVIELVPFLLVTLEELLASLSFLVATEASVLVLFLHVDER